MKSKKNGDINKAKHSITRKKKKEKRTHKNNRKRKNPILRELIQI